MLPDQAGGILLKNRGQAPPRTDLNPGGGGNLRRERRIPWVPEKEYPARPRLTGGLALSVGNDTAAKFTGIEVRPTDPSGPWHRNSSPPPRRRSSPLVLSGAARAPPTRLSLRAFAPIIRICASRSSPASPPARSRRSSAARPRAFRGESGSPGRALVRHHGGPGLPASAPPLSPARCFGVATYHLRRCSLPAIEASPLLVDTDVAARGVEDFLGTSAQLADGYRREPAPRDAARHCHHRLELATTGQPHHLQGRARSRAGSARTARAWRRGSRSITCWPPPRCQSLSRRRGGGPLVRRRRHPPHLGINKTLKTKRIK